MRPCAVCDTRTAYGLEGPCSSCAQDRARAELKVERANPDARGFYTWTVEISVHETWVEDGFDLTDARALDMLANDLRYANIGRELRARVLSAPDPVAIKKAQGH